MGSEVKLLRDIIKEFENNPKIKKQKSGEIDVRRMSLLPR